MSRGRRRRASAHRRGRGRGPARGRQRGRRRGRRGARLLRGREPADRVRRRRLHDGPRARRARPTLIDFFVAAPGPRRDRARRRAGPGAGPLRRRDRADVLRRPRLLRRARAPPPGLVRALERFGSVPLADAGRRRRSRLAREGAPVNAEQAYILEILAPIHERLAGHARALRAGGAAAAARATSSASPSWPRRWNASAPRGRSRSTAARSAAALSDFVVEHGGTLGRGDLAAYEAIERAPDPRRRSAAPRCCTNPPPSSGGILIAYCLGLLERLGERSGPEQLVAAMGAANGRRGLEFAEALYEEGMEAGFLDPAGLDLAAADLLGSTTHISVLDGDGHVRQRHLLQRLRLGRAGARHRRDPQQHARRGGPQPARLPPHRARAAGCPR